MNSLQIKVDELWRGVITHDMKVKFNFVLLTRMSLITKKICNFCEKVITLIVQKQKYFDANIIIQQQKFLVDNLNNVFTSLDH